MASMAFVLCISTQAQIKVSDTATIQLYFKKTTALRGTNNDSALFWINRAVKLCRDKKINDLYDDALYLKATVYYYAGDVRTSESVQQLSIKAAKATGDKKMMIKNYNLFGAIAYTRGDYTQAEKYYSKNLEIAKEIKDTSVTIEAYYNISLIYSSIGNHKKAAAYNYKILHLAQSFHDDEAILLSSQGLAESYSSIMDHKKARYYLQRAKKMALQLKDDYALSGIYIDYGNFFQNISKPDSSIYYYNQAIIISQARDDKYHEAIATCNKAVSFYLKKEYKAAEELLVTGIKINEEIERSQGMAQAWKTMAECQMEQNKFKEALSSARKALYYSNDVKSIEDMALAAEVLYKVFQRLNQSDSALHYLRQHYVFKDSLDETSQTREIANQELEFEKLRAEQIRLNEKKLNEKELKTQRKIRNAFLIFSVLILVTLLFLFRNYRAKKKANTEINEQKLIIESRNKDILDSINYSRRIQQAILTPDAEIKKLLPNAFVFFKPKDIVSGDFYFIEPVHTNDGSPWIAAAVADCTGHGVPGAFMSIMGYNFLKQSLKEKDVNDPGTALDFVNRELGNFLRTRDERDVIRDGMDVSFCAFNADKRILQFAGANNPLWIASKSSMIQSPVGSERSPVMQMQEYYMFEIKADKQHVGFNEKQHKFTNHVFELQKGDWVFMFSDGYPDQFGLTEEQWRTFTTGKDIRYRKIKYKPFMELILSNIPHGPDGIKKGLEQHLENWKGNMTQTDDISIIGFMV